MTMVSDAKLGELAARREERYCSKLREMGVDHFDERGELPDEYRQLLRELVRVQVDVEGVLLFHDWIRPWLDVAPTPRDRMRIGRLHAEELVHGYQFLKMYKSIDHELTAEDFADEEARKAQYIFNYAFDTWVDIALLNTLADRMGAFVFADMEECSYLPWRRITGRIAKDERGHTALGFGNLREICETEEGRAEAQQLLYKWYPASLDMFGRTDSDRQWDYLDWGLKKSTNEELRRSFVAQVDPLIESLGLEVPPYEYNRRFL
ncbi:MAG TPA: Phenylacetic acid catabolic protein [Acidimicrobiales bacterium]|nr:Phenylacetic acid catabolic protein [Acidimicrobiales bacterium]